MVEYVQAGCQYITNSVDSPPIFMGIITRSRLKNTFEVPNVSISTTFHNFSSAIIFASEYFLLFLFVNFRPVMPNNIYLPSSLIYHWHIERRVLF